MDNDLNAQTYESADAIPDVMTPGGARTAPQSADAVMEENLAQRSGCLLYTSPSPRDS